MINGENAQIVAIIPARFGSTRFPGKPLVMIQGKTMIQRVYEQVCQARLVDTVVIATDDERIFQHATNFGAPVLMTRAEHPSGTDRCAEAASNFQNARYIVNVQGDEPFIQPEQIDLLVRTLQNKPEFGVATLAKQLMDREALFNPNVVKVVFSEQNGALYFSRHPIPFVRNHPTETWISTQPFFKHIGLYGFRADLIQRLAALEPSPLERAESLEQLRWLENGFRIAVAITEYETIGIDSPDDLLKLNG
ncbi:MAG: 3-deoxy-manno-octulosonate cytidylyltransferase [Saprospiraceae bacterium]|nr:3-deoxy-manno-octulosonate cytidylyltransferase [Saprospiraceae bacterium]